MQSIPSRVQKFLMRRLGKPKGIFNALPDQRQQGKIKHELPVITTALLLGLIANRRTLRDVEAMTGKLEATWRKLVPGTISDSTLDCRPAPVVMAARPRRIRSVAPGDGP